MARLTKEERDALPDSEFAIPERREYPIPDRTHAVDALARVSENGDEGEKLRVAQAVHRKFPDIREKLHEMSDDNE